MKKTILSAALAAAFVALPCATADAATVYLLDDGINSILSVDSNTGTILGSFAAPTAFLTVAGLSMAEGGSVLIYTDDGNSAAAVSPLYRLDPATGAVLSTHALPINDRGGLSYQGTTVLSVNNGGPLFSQTPYGAVGGSLPFNLSPGFPGALGGDDTGRHFLAGIDVITLPAGGPAPGPQGYGIYEHDVTGTILNMLPDPTGNQALSGLAFDGVDLYAVELGSRLLYTLDPSTGAIRNAVTVAGSGDLVGAAVAPIPEPSTLALFGLGAFGLVGIVRRRRKRKTA